MSFEFGCQKEGETDAAIKVLDLVSGEYIWFPLSQVESMHFDSKGQGYIVVSDWIARQKGLG